MSVLCERFSAATALCRGGCSTRVSITHLLRRRLKSAGLGANAMVNDRGKKTANGRESSGAALAYRFAGGISILALGHAVSRVRRVSEGASGHGGAREH